MVRGEIPRRVRPVYLVKHSGRASSAATGAGSGGPCLLPPQRESRPVGSPFPTATLVHPAESSRKSHSAALSGSRNPVLCEKLDRASPMGRVERTDVQRLPPPGDEPLAGWQPDTTRESQLAGPVRGATLVGAPTPSL